MAKNILLAIKSSQQGSKLKKILTSHGYQIISVVDDAYSALRTLRSKEVALTLIDYDLSGLNGLQLAKIIADEKLGPIILLSQHYLDTGNITPTSLYGILVKPFTEYQLINTLKLALAQYKNQKNLEKELENLKEKLESRKLIEKAKGILMEKYGLNEDEAYNKLRNTSMEKRIPMKKVADAIILMDEF